MKTLYTFKGEVGGEIFDISLKKPNRSEMEDISIFEAAMKSKLMNLGVQTRAAVDKYYADNCDGAMTHEDEVAAQAVQQELDQKREELLTSVGEESTESRSELYGEITRLEEKVRQFNEYYSAIYDDTVEVKARNKTIDYAFLNFSLLS